MSILVLDVGGTIYKTTKHTIRLSTYLSNIVSTNNWSQNEIFIDRDGQLFHYILEYLRTENIHAPDHLLPSLKTEAQFYNIPQMEKEIDKILESKQVSVTMEEGIISLREINKLSNIKVDYSLSQVKPLPVNKNGYNILTTLSCLKDIYKCPRNISTHIEPYQCGKSCEKLVSEENRWVKEEVKMYLVSRNKN